MGLYKKNKKKNYREKKKKKKKKSLNAFFFISKFETPLQEIYIVQSSLPQDLSHMQN